jgi:hypothetical protein
MSSARRGWLPYAVVGGAYGLALIGLLAASLSQRAPFRERVAQLEQDVVRRGRDAALTNPLRARLLAHAGLQQVLAEARLRGVESLPETFSLGDRGPVPLAAIDRAFVRVLERSGEHVELEVETKLVGLTHMVDGEMRMGGATFLVRARARVTSEGVELLKVEESPDPR